MSDRILMDVKFGDSIDYASHSPANKEWKEYNKRLRFALGYVTDKYGRSQAWNVISGVWDFEKMGIAYKILVEQSSLKEVFVSCEDICKEFGWKSFEINDTHSTVFPEPLSWEEKEAIVSPLVTRTKVKDLKTLREMEKNGTLPEPEATEDDITEEDDEKTEDTLESDEEPTLDIDDL